MPDRTYQVRTPLKSQLKEGFMFFSFNTLFISKLFGFFKTLRLEGQKVALKHILSVCYLFMLLQNIAFGFDPMIHRSEIQQFFVKYEGNSIRSKQWMSLYLKKEVDWQGLVYAIKRHPESNRVEFLLKILPESVLYDTVVVVEGNTEINPFIQKGTVVKFHGKIFNGVDFMGVKEVQVLLNSPQDIQPNGDQPVNYTESPLEPKAQEADLDLSQP
ncbi:MAG: hypothetical protein K2X66_09410 [Cyanobacteria bacterium]|nr:hypothetical protein [Cyanobacteriota bacterium]